MKQVRLRDEDHEALKRLQSALRRLTGLDISLSQAARYGAEAAIMFRAKDLPQINDALAAAGIHASPAGLTNHFMS